MKEGHVAPGIVFVARPWSGQATASTNSNQTPIFDTGTFPVVVLTIRNLASSGGQSVFIGPISVSTTNGHEILPGEIQTWAFAPGVGIRLRELAVVTSSSTSAVSWLAWG